MANTLKFKRGLLAGLPTAAEGEPLFTTDTKDLYIGTSTGNQRFQKYIASGATTQILRGDGSLYSFPLAISSPSNGQVLKFNGTNWVNDSDAGITGSLTTNYLPKATGATTLGNSLVFDNGTTVGVGATSFAYSPKLAISSVGQNSLAIQTTDVVQGSTGTILYLGTNATTGNTFGVIRALGTGGTAVANLVINPTGGNLLLNTTSDSGQGQVLQVNGTTLVTAGATLTTSTFSHTNVNGGINVVNSSTLASGRDAQLRLVNGSTVFGASDRTHQLINTGRSASDSDFAVFYWNGSTYLERLRIFSTGNIGIGTGTTDYTTKLQVIGTSYFDNSIGIGTTTLTGYTMRVQKTMTGSTVVWGIQNSGIIQSDVTAVASYYSTQASTQATTFSLSGLYHYAANQTTIGAGSSVGSQIGFFADSSLIGGTNNYGFYGNIPSGTNRWNLYMVGSARNYLAGRLLLATQTDLGNIVSNLQITGSTVMGGIVQLGTVQTGVSSLGVGFWNTMNLATSGTFGSYMHYRADVGTLGGSTLTNQYGYFVSGTAIGATNNYGFFSDIASGTGRWNFYANGSASNYFAGKLLLGSTTDTTELLQVNGTAKITGATNIGGDLTINRNWIGTTSVIVQNPNTDTSSFATQSQFRVDVAANQIGALKSTARNLNGLSRSSLYLTTIGSYDLAFGVNSSATPSMVLDINGNLGIAINSPTERLHVSGNAIITGNLTVDTNTLFVDSTNNSIAIGTTTINASAVLQADSTTKGFLPPRMTTTQKNAIGTPAAGLVVYDTTLNKLCVYTTAWETITSV